MEKSNRIEKILTKRRLEKEIEREERLRGILVLVGLFIVGLITVVVSWNRSKNWTIIGFIVLGLVGLTSYHISKKYKEEENVK